MESVYNEELEKEGAQSHPVYPPRATPSILPFLPYSELRRLTFRAADTNGGEAFDPGEYSDTSRARNLGDASSEAETSVSPHTVFVFEMRRKRQHGQKSVHACFSLPLFFFFI